MNEMVLLIVIIIGLVANGFSLFVSAKILISYDKLIDLQTEYIRKVIDISLTALSVAHPRIESETEEDKS